MERTSNFEFTINQMVGSKEALEESMPGLKESLDKVGYRIEDKCSANDCRLRTAINADREMCLMGEYGRLCTTEVSVVIECETRSDSRCRVIEKGIGSKSLGEITGALKPIGDIKD